MDVLNYINGTFSPPSNNEWIENYDPATDNLIGKVPRSSNEDLNQALVAAKNAQKNWADSDIETRASYLLKLSEKIEENIEELAFLETRDTGKPINTSLNIDIPRSALNLRFFAEFAKKQNTELFNRNGFENFVERSPLGAVACISPWNLPLYLFTWKIAPALITGNTVIAKPSEFTPTTAYMLSKFCDEVKLPPGVLNILHGLGSEVGSAIVENPSVKAVSFTGSTRVGKLIAKTCGEQMKKVSLELGGKNPFIITENANIEAAVSTAMRAAFTNQGQVCLCGSRIYIHESIYNQVKTQLIEKLKTLIPSDPKEKSSRFGSLTSKSHFDKVNNYLEMAKRDPSIKLHLFDHNIQFGNFISPALLENVPPDHAINQEEIFGPIATLQSYSSEDELINLANNTEYGLCASIYSQDKDQAKRLASKIEAGIVWINTWLERDLRTPFGGAKASGFGREGGNYALNFFTETKNICIPEEK